MSNDPYNDDEFEDYSFPKAEDKPENALADDDLDDDYYDLDDDLGYEEPLLDPAVEEELRAEDEPQMLLVARQLNKIYRQGHKRLHVMKNVDLRITSGEITALVGPSGSGKSTLLQILGLLDTPTSGQIVMGGHDISKLNDKARTKLRSTHIGFVYQFHHLLPEFTALENVAMPQIILGEKPSYAKDKGAILLEHLGLAERLNHRPAALSGGEQQRVAIARALVNDPYLLFADEPTGNLDPESSAEVFDLLMDLVRSRGVGALIATHNMELAQSMDRILEVKSGRILPF